MIWIYCMMGIIDGMLPFFIKSCPLFWALCFVMLLMQFFCDKIPHIVKWLLVAALIVIGTTSIILYFESAYTTVALPLAFAESVLTTALVIMTPVTSRQKKTETIFLK